MTSRIIVISTRPPVFPLSGGMAPNVKDACSAFDAVTWYALGAQDGPSDEFSKAAGNRIGGKDLRISTVDGMEVKQIMIDPTKWDQHYNMASNSVVWPLSHDRLDLTARFGTDEYFGTLQVNKEMAGIVARDLADDKTTPIWIQDYHHLRLPYFLRKEGVKNPIVFFNHIPLPSPKTVAKMPEHDRVHFLDLLTGLHYCDAANFQTEEAARRFMKLTGLESPVQTIGIYKEAVVHIEDGKGGHDLRIGNFPISIATGRLKAKAVDPSPLSPPAQALKDELTAPFIFINFERCDYSKGIYPRLKAFAMLMEQQPSLRDKVQLVIGAEPTRKDIKEYQDYADKVQGLINEINGKWADRLGYAPVVLLPKSIPNIDVIRLMRNDAPGQRKIGTVTPYRDGMNLVAKEFYAAQDPQNAGVLILSKGAGAAYEMGAGNKGAVTYSPEPTRPGMSPDEVAEPIYKAMLTAIKMPQAEANARCRAMQAHLDSHDNPRWGKAHRDQMDEIAGGKPAVQHTPALKVGGLRR